MRILNVWTVGASRQSNWLVAQERGVNILWFKMVEYAQSHTSMQPPGHKLKKILYALMSIELAQALVNQARHRAAPYSLCALKVVEYGHAST